MHLLNKHKQYTQQGGFTLIELMVTVAIIAILVAVAAPSFTDSITRSKVKSSYDQLSSLLMFAKTEAVTRGVNVTATYASTGDINVRYTDSKNNIVKLRTASLSDGRVKFGIDPSSTTAITFLPSGQLSGNATITITSCDAGKKLKKRQIIISPVGRITNKITADDCDL